MKTVLNMLLYFKLLKFVLFFLACFYTTNLPAQNKNWVNYTALYEGKPGIIDLNLALKGKAPLPSQPFLVMTALRMQKSTERGLASSIELSTLQAFSDSVEVLLKQNVDFSFAGNFTHGGIRINYFYISDSIGLRSKFTAMYAQAYPKYTLGLTFKYEKDWQTYFEFLFPGDEAIKVIQKKKAAISTAR